MWLEQFVGTLAVEPLFIPSTCTGSLESIPYGGMPCPGIQGPGEGLGPAPSDVTDFVNFPRKVSPSLRSRWGEVGRRWGALEERRERNLSYVR